MAVLAGLRTGEGTSSVGHGAAIYPVWQHDGMSSTLGAAVVGTGFGVITHARALDAAGIEVRALIGRDPDKTAKRAAMFGIPHATTDRAEAFARDDIDVVAVDHTAVLARRDRPRRGRGGEARAVREAVRA